MGRRRGSEVGGRAHVTCIGVSVDFESEVITAAEGWGEGGGRGGRRVA